MRKAIEFRFMLIHAIEGNLLIDEPVGWSGVKFKLERDKKYHSILFEYSTQLEFRRANNGYNGGAEFLLYIESKYGPDAIVNIQVEISDHGREWEVVYLGKLNLEDLIETEKGVTCISEQEDFWTTFDQRTGLQVSFKDNKSVDGVALQTYTPYALSMHSKVLVKQVRSEVKTGEQPIAPLRDVLHFTIPAGAPGWPDAGRTGIFPNQPDTTPIERTAYLQYGFPAGIKELTDYWEVAGGASDNEPPPIYTAKEEGLHTFDIKIDLTAMVSVKHVSTLVTSKAQCGLNDGTLDIVKIKTFFIIRDKDDVEKYQSSVDWGSSNHCGTMYADITGPQIIFLLSEFQLQVGDKVFLYTAVAIEAEYERFVAINAINALWAGFLLNEGSYLKITGKTFTLPSTAPAMRIHDVLQNLCNKLTNRNDSFYSETFGYIGAPYHSYVENGVYADYVIQNGFNIRNFPYVDRPLQLDFKTIYESLDAIFCLSLSLEEIEGVQRLRIESLNYAYTKENILSFTFISKMKRNISKDKFYNQIRIGYEKSLPEDINGLDEFCTIHNYTTDLKTIGETLNLVSQVIASGSLIEVTRRAQYNATLTTDTAYDNLLFIVAVLHTDPTKSERNEYFDTVNNLLSPETAYNLRLWTAYNLLRQGNKINGGLLKKLGTKYNFQSGEGNYIVQMEQKVSEIVYPGSYNAELLKGGESILWAYAELPEVEPLWSPNEYIFEYPFSLRELNVLKANRNKSIFISGDLFPEGGIEAFILEVEAEVTRGIGKFKMIAANELPFNYVPEDAETLLLQDGFDLLMENGDLILL